MEQFVTSPTRQNNILDLVFSTHHKISNLSTVPGMSDHEALAFHLDLSQKSSQAITQHQVALYYKANIAQIKEDLLIFQQIFLSNNPLSRSVDQNWQELKQAINDAVLKHVPHRTVRTRNCLPWITKPIKKDMKKRKLLYDKAKASNLHRDWEAYRRVKNEINVKLKEAHNMYYSRLFDDSFNCNRRQFWKYIRARRQNDHSIPTLYVNDQPINSPKDKSDALNNHFISVFTKEDLSKVPNIEDVEVTIPNISPIIFTQSGIQHLLSTLDVSKASGPDRVSPYTLKHCAEELSPVLQIIFTQSL